MSTYRTAAHRNVLISPLVLCLTVVLSLELVAVRDSAAAPPKEATTASAPAMPPAPVPTTLPAVKLPIAREIKLPADVPDGAQPVWVFEKLGKIVLRASDGNSGSGYRLVVVADGKVQAIGEIIPQLRDQQVSPVDMPPFAAAGNVLALKGDGERTLWLADLAKGTAAKIETKESPAVAFAGDRVFIAYAIKSEQRMSNILCYTLDGKQVDLPAINGMPLIGAADGKSFYAIGFEDTLAEPVLYAKLKQVTARIYQVGIDGKVLRKSTMSAARPPHRNSISPGGTFVSWLPDEEMKAYVAHVDANKGGNPHTRRMTHVIENLVDGGTRKVSVVGLASTVCVLTDGRAMAMATDPTAAQPEFTLQLFSADGTKLQPYSTPIGFHEFVRQGDTFYFLPKGAKAIQVVELGELK